MSIKADVDRGLEIATSIDALKEELKQIEARLSKAGLNGPQIDLNDAEREGKQYLAKGSNRVVPVVFTADLVAKSFLEKSPMHHQIAAAVTKENFSAFYVPKTTYNAIFESGKVFRSLAADLLGSEAAPKFISACLTRDKHGIPKSQIKVEWDRAEAVKESEVTA